MISTEYILSMLGKVSTDQKLVEYLSLNDIFLDKELSLEESEYDTHIERPDLGFSLLFTDEAKFLGLAEQSIGSGGLYFSAIFFYSEGEEDFNEYKYDLPSGLSFDDKEEDVRKKLGAHSWQRLDEGDERIISQRWDISIDTPYSIHITYEEGTEKICVIIAHIPNKPLVL